VTNDIFQMKKEKWGCRKSGKEDGTKRRCRVVHSFPFGSRRAGDMVFFFVAFTRGDLNEELRIKNDEFSRPLPHRTDIACHRF
jgi:hypothetical protein